MNIRIIVTCIIFGLSASMHGAAKPLSSSRAFTSLTALFRSTPAPQISPSLISLKNAMQTFPPGVRNILLQYIPEQCWHGGEFRSHTFSPAATLLGSYRYSPDASHAAFVESFQGEIDPALGGPRIHYNIVIVDTKNHKRIFAKEFSTNPDVPFNEMWNCFYWSCDGKKLAYRDDANIVVVSHPFSSDSEPIFRKAGVNAAWSCTDNDILALDCPTGLFAYNVSTQEALTKIDHSADFDTFRILSWHPRSSCLAAFSKGGTKMEAADITTYNVATTSKLYNFTPPRHVLGFIPNISSYCDVAFSPDGALLAVADSFSVTFYNALTGKPQPATKSFPIHFTRRLIWLGDTTLCIGHAPTDDIIATIINTETNSVIGTVPCPPGPNNTVYSWDYCLATNQLTISAKVGEKTTFYVWEPDTKALSGFDSAATPKTPQLQVGTSYGSSSSSSSYSRVAGAHVSPHVPKAVAAAHATADAPPSPEHKDRKEEAKEEKYGSIH